MNQNGSSNEISFAFVQFTHIDYVIVTTLLLISLAIGIFIGYFHNGDRTTQDFLFGSFKMKSIPIALSLLAR